MKKILFMIFVFIGFAFLVSCNKTDYAKLGIEEVAITYATGDNSSSVTKDLKLPTNVTVEGKEVSIAWKSSNTAVVSNSGKVTRATENKNVTLEAVATYGKKESQPRNFAVVVLALDPSAGLLQDAKNSLILSVADPGNVVSDFTVYTQLPNNISVSWSSSEPGSANVGEPNASNIATVAINRSDADVTVVLTATLTLGNLTETKTFTILIPATTVLFPAISTIAEILAITDVALDGKVVSTTIKNATVFAKGDDAAFIYDGTGVTEVYGGQFTNLAVGKVYDVKGTLEWYFGLWEICDSIVTEVVGAAPAYPTKEVVTSVEAKIDALNAANEHKHADIINGSLQPQIITVTGKVYLIPADATNYNTWIIDSTATALVQGAAEVPARGFMIYYHTLDFAYIKTFAGKQVTLDLVVYTYRTNNFGYAAYYVGGPSGITAILTDQDIVEIEAAKLSQPRTVLESGTLAFPTTGADGTSIAWSSDKEGTISVATGAVTVAPGESTEVILTAVVTLNGATFTRTFHVVVGEPDATPLNAVTTTSKYYWVEGIVTGHNGLDTIFVEDATGAIAVYGASFLAPFVALLGHNVKFEGKYSPYGGLPELVDITLSQVLDKGEASIPAYLAIVSSTVWDVAGLVDHIGRLVQVEGIVTAVDVNATYGNITVTIIDPVSGQSINLYWDARALFGGTAETPASIVTALKGLAAGDYVTVTSHLAASGNKPRLVLSNAAVIVERAATDAEKAQAAKAALVLSSSKFSAAGTIALPTTGLFGATVVWSSDNALIDAATGAVVLPVENVIIVVILSASITVGEETIIKTFEIRVGQDGASQTVVAKWPGGSGNTTNMHTNGDANAASLIGLDPAVFTVVSDKGGGGNHVGLNQKGHMALYYLSGGKGVILSITIAEGYEIDSITLLAARNNTTAPNAIFTLTIDGNEETKEESEITVAASTTSLADPYVTQEFSFVIGGKSFALQNTCLANTQIWFTQISIVFHAL
ncbi:MAG: hypothetical protein LBV51_05895 [Acholeplasmatales bacterium]|jgi:hypothetical protein|nr:hypothetical protein [Acholeplasmatales bacterium]